MAERDTDAELAGAFARYLDEERTAYSEAIAKLFGPLPAWLPEPVVPLIRQAVASLQTNGGHSDQIMEIVAQARAHKLIVPGSANDAIDFIKSAHYLAHVQWALGLDKTRTILELGGSRAAQDYQRSKSGNEALYGTEAQRQSRDCDIRAKAAALRELNSRLSVNAIANKLAQTVGLSAGHIKRILRSGQ